MSRLMPIVSSRPLFALFTGSDQVAETNEMAKKPVVFVTRKLPEAVHERLRRDYEPRLNLSDRLYSGEQLARVTEGADALLPCPTDKLTASVIEALPGSIKIIATFSVGYEHIDTAAAKARGIIVTNTPDVLTDATADLSLIHI